MTRIDGLKSQIADKQKRMKELNTLAETGKRVKTEVERTEFDTLIGDVRNLEKELQDVEATERIKIEAPVIISSEQKNKNKRYDIVKAISEFSTGRISGLEAEMHQESQRTNQNATGLLIPNDMIYKRTETLANSTGLYTQNAVGLDIIAPISLADKLGITKYDNLTSTYKFNYTQGQEADVVAEGASLSGKTYTKLTDEIVPMAYGYSVPVSKQALAVTSMLQGFILDADNAINSKILATLLTAIDNDMYALVGYSGATTTAALTSAVLGKLKASVLSAMFNKPGFVMGSELYSEVENTAGVTGIKTVLQDGKINGFNAFDVMTLMKVHNTSAYSVIFGDWSRAAIGTWGSALEVLVDPFTLSASNQINLTFNRLADSTFNPYAFKVIRNGKIS